MNKEMYAEIKKELVDLIKDKAFVVWGENSDVDTILDKYGLYDDRKTFVDITTRLCLELSEQFESYEIDSDIIFSTSEIEYYVKLGKLLDILDNTMFTKEELRQAINKVGITFRGRPLSELSLDKIYELIYNEDDGLIRQSVFVVFGNKNK